MLINSIGYHFVLWFHITIKYSVLRNIGIIQILYCTINISHINKEHLKRNNNTADNDIK